MCKNCDMISVKACFFEAVQIVPREDEISLFPSGEESIPLLPEEAALQGVKFPSSQETLHTHTSTPGID